MLNQLGLAFNQPLSLFPEEDDEPVSGLRYYQQDALEATRASLVEHRAVLNVLATGLGKTQIFCALARDWPGRVLVLAHRDELVSQARDRLEEMTGEYVEIEQGEWKASDRARLVVGSVDSVRQPKRLARMGKDRFSLIIVDEAHHYVAKTYQRPLAFFADAKILGVTATPDRGDKKALGKLFEDVAYVMDILDGIEAGYLVPVKGREVELPDLDISKIKVVGGDLADNELDTAMAHVVDGICQKTLECAPGRQGIGFFPGIRSAELAMHKMNMLKPGSAAFISGATERRERRRIIADFRAGRYQYLMNCQVATEGFDAPTASVIIQARPTLSRAFYAQTCGRGTRVLPGTIDHLEGAELSTARREAIAASGKPDMLILDFVGNAGKHSLCRPEDLLGGTYSDDEIAAAKKATKENPDVATHEALQQARTELQRLAREVQLKHTSRVSPFDPFHVLELPDENRYASYGRVAPATTGQLTALERIGIPKPDLQTLSKRAASKLLDTLNTRRKQGLCSYKQARWLKLHGVDSQKVSFKEASKALDYLFNQRAKGGPVDPVKLAALTTKERP